MERTWTVYMHVSPSNKRYIGITSQDPPTKRWANGRGGYNDYFKKAVKKYGWDNFQHIIIATGLTKDDAKQMEIDLIKKYQSNKRQYGYNITAGGDTLCDINRDLFSYPVYQFDLDFNYIATYFNAREAAEALGKGKTAIVNCCNLDKNYAHGFIWRYKKDVQDPYDKSTIPKRQKKLNCRPVYQIDYNTREYTLWDCPSDATKALSIPYKEIMQCCKSKTHISRRDIMWVFQDDIDNIEHFINDDDNFIKVPRSKKVWQCDCDDKPIKLFQSITDAAKELGLNKDRISKVCHNMLDMYGGYKWKFVTQEV